MYDTRTGMSFDPKAQDTAFPEFFVKAVQNNFRSEKEGRAVFDDLEYVRIYTPGDAKSVPERQVKPDDKLRWPRQYEAFKSGLEIAATGTPLENWPPISATPGLIAELKALNIRNVEGLASVPDGHLANLGTGGRVWRDKAAAWLQQALDGAPLAEAEQKLDALRGDLAVKEKQIADLQAAVAKLQEKADA